MGRDDIKELLSEIARPRLTGSAGALAIAELVRARLTSAGYHVRDFPFAFSTWPGRFAVSLIGLIFLAGTLGAAALLDMRHPGVALAVLLLVLLLAGALAALVPVLANTLPFGRVLTANLFAAKPGKRPRYIVMAHLDSKSQPIPLAFRGPAIIAAIAAWVAFTAFTTLALLDPVWLMPRFTTLLTVLCLIAGSALVFCWVGNRSPGALDNGSGLGTLIGVAEQDHENDDVAFLVTDAEELGLVGARSVARQLDPVVGVINVDGIDDDGTFYVLERFGIPARYFAPHLAAAVLQAADELALSAQRRKVPFGLLLDHIPLARANLPAVTLMRGSLRSLRRVHRPADSIAALTGDGVQSAIAVVRRSLEILRRNEAGPSL